MDMGWLVVEDGIRRNSTDKIKITVFLLKTLELFGYIYTLTRRARRRRRRRTSRAPWRRFMAWDSRRGANERQRLSYMRRQPYWERWPCQWDTSRWGEAGVWTPPYWNTRGWRRSREVRELIVQEMRNPGSEICAALRKLGWRNEWLWFL